MTNINTTCCAGVASICKSAPTVLPSVNDDNPYVIIEYMGDQYKTRRDIFNDMLVQRSMPCGTIMEWFGDDPPYGWIVCDGSIFDKNTYRDLFDALGSDEVPNLQGRICVQQNDGTFSELLVNGNDGTLTRQMDIEMMPKHSHTYKDAYETNNGHHDDDGGHKYNPNKHNSKRTAWTDPVGMGNAWLHTQGCLTTTKIIKATPFSDSNRNVIPNDGLYQRPPLPFPDITPPPFTPDPILPPTPFVDLNDCYNPLTVVLTDTDWISGEGETNEISMSVSTLTAEDVNNDPYILEQYYTREIGTGLTANPVTNTPLYVLDPNPSSPAGALYPVTAEAEYTAYMTISMRNVADDIWIPNPEYPPPASSDEYVDEYINPTPDYLSGDSFWYMYIQYESRNLLYSTTTDTYEWADPSLSGDMNGRRKRGSDILTYASPPLTSCPQSYPIWTTNYLSGDYPSGDWIDRSTADIFSLSGTNYQITSFLSA